MSSVVEGTSAPDLSTPTRRIPDNASDPGGWGLGIIASLSTYYDCRPEQHGKCVWAVLGIEPPYENALSS